MNLLVPLASLFGIEIKAIVDQAKRSAIALATLALFSLFSAVFLLLAAFLALAAWIGQFWAALAIGIGSALIAVGVWIALWIIHDRQRRIEATRRKSVETTALVTTAALTALPMLFKSPFARSVGLPIIGLLTVALSGAETNKRT